MDQHNRLFVGLDVSKLKIPVAVADGGAGSERHLGRPLGTQSSRGASAGSPVHCGQVRRSGPASRVAAIVGKAVSTLFGPTFVHCAARQSHVVVDNI